MLNCCVLWPVQQFLLLLLILLYLFLQPSPFLVILYRQSQEFLVKRNRLESIIFLELNCIFVGKDHPLMVLEGLQPDQTFNVNFWLGHLQAVKLMSLVD